MMGSFAYGDYSQRMREAVLLIRNALESKSPIVASATTKGAAILAAAALERYMNDVVVEECRKLKVSQWSELTEGHKRYLTRQIARLLYKHSSDARRNRGEEGARDKLRNSVGDCERAFQSPQTWPNFPAFGAFMKGQASAEKIIKLLKMFDAHNRDFGQFLRTRGADVRALFTGLTQLVNTRHAAAHALRGTTQPSPRDVQTWIVLSWRLTRQVEAYLGHRT